MTEKTQQPSPAPMQHDESDEPFISVDVTGIDRETWKEHGSKLSDRLKNTVKKLFGGDIPPRAETIARDVEGFIDGIAASAHEKLKSSKMVNIERQASIVAKLAEAKERDANARRINLEADKMEMELEEKRKMAKVFEAEKAISLMIQRGELTIQESADGRTLIIYDKK